MIWSAVLWYLLVSALGLLIFPLAYRLFPGLNDRGYTVSRTFGLLIWGFLFWVLSSYGLLANTIGGYLLALLLVVGLVYWALRRHPLTEITAWIKERKGFLLSVELLFLAAFTFIAIMRAMEPELITTEKPMELAFINAILRSPSMPPLDPWLADYSISYYYFGYVIVAMLAKITGVTAGLAFNLAISLVFALSAVGAYGVVYNLLAAFKPGERLSRALFSVLGPVFVLLVSNLEGFLEYLHGKGYFWTQAADGTWQSRFWSWLQILNLSDPPPFNTTAGEQRHWWWWRASRVIYDQDLLGNHREVIDEFPFFSYFLGDLHPHVLSMPFVFLALALALNIFLHRKEVERPFWVLRPDFRALVEFRFGWRKFYFHFSPATFWFSAVILGGLAFLNIWDWPWYVGIFSAAYVLRRAQQAGWRWVRLGEFIGLGLLLGIAGGLAYLPYYIGFSSQAGGVLPNVIHPTRGIHLWVMFGSLFLPIFVFLICSLLRKRDIRSLTSGFSWTLLGTLLLFAGSVVPVLVLGWLSVSDGAVADGARDFLASFGGGSYQELIRISVTRRAEAIAGLFTLVLLIGFAAAVLWPKRQRTEETSFKIESAELERKTVLPDSHLFVALLILFGGLLVILPEFVFLRDLFSHRMNTIFKFYYQAWLLCGVAAAYASAVMLSRRDLIGAVYGLFLAAVLTLGLVYPVMAVNSRVSGFQQRGDVPLNLDGTAGPQYYFLSEDERQAVAWLKQAPLGTLVEAVGGSYSSFARISANSGQPALIGWPWHETQWRGSGEAAGTREQDIYRLYSTQSWPEADQIIQQYGIRYIVVSSLERTTYRVEDEKFVHYLTPVFQSGPIVIYETSITNP